MGVIRAYSVKTLLFHSSTVMSDDGTMRSGLLYVSVRCVRTYSPPTDSSPPSTGYDRISFEAARRLRTRFSEFTTRSACMRLISSVCERDVLPLV